MYSMYEFKSLQSSVTYEQAYDTCLLLKALAVYITKSDLRFRSFEHQALRNCIAVLKSKVTWRESG